VIIEEPYPRMMIFNLNWNPADITHTNCMKILCSLPFNNFLSQTYSAPSVNYLYRLNAIVAFSGSHYLVFLRIKQEGNKPRVWTLFNDTYTEKFEDYGAVASYLVSANVVPTLVLYEQQSYNLPNFDQTEASLNQSDEDWLMLYLHAT
jgi:hypothetical protein